MFWVAIACEIGRAFVSHTEALFFSYLFSSDFSLKRIVKRRGKPRQYFTKEVAQDISVLRIDEALFVWHCATQAFVITREKKMLLLQLTL